MKHSTTSRAPARLLSTIGLATGLALTVTACSTGTPSADSSTGTARPHGYVAGASESQEPQVRLLAVSASGATALHDLLTEETTELDDVDAPEHSATDGRFLVTSDADRTTIVDGGSWTVDHGDHTHYYAAEPRVVGTIDGGGRVAVHSSETMTTITWPDRAEAVVLDREALGQGEVDETARIDASVLLPMGEQLVAADGDTVRVLDADGEATDAAGAAETCTDPAGGIVTRAGAVVGCADGAVVVDDSSETSFVDLPDGAERPTAFAARAGRPTVAGLAGTTGFWLLDVRQGSWRLVPTERPLRAAVAVDDEDEHVVGVDESGRVVVVTASTGKVATTKALIDTGADGPAPMLQLDAQRAYVADPSDGTVHEIDFADGARVARTIELPAAPVAFAEVGL
ncbi:ABC transporter [Curtobacterium flaccumfaciens pv. flaccumfaciens]|uniref:YncE family protein n=1 Tax=Curtobacterium flaccumfaciens TaxID=2035 RepID=UPI00217D5377|nr:ABC transporter [Curtobacterium flaccumfaciens]MCS6569296.1 ABC transporter [Curtobacterium flaccumfaciens pv. flaccumfaciens]MCS6584400.1 ABC transporter [Curtobacterium flaccumfaciens pv. flaccumfaciens]